MPELLIVDDIPAVHDMLEPLFQHEGYTCHRAHSADEAVAFLQNQSCDIALIDYYMPVEDGLILSKDILQGYPGIKIVMMSGYFDDKLRNAARDAGIHALVEKPFNMRELVETINRIEKS